MKNKKLLFAALSYLTLLASTASAQRVSALDELKASALGDAAITVPVPAVQQEAAAAGSQAAKSTGRSTRKVAVYRDLEIVTTIETSVETVTTTKTPGGVESERVVRKEITGSVLWWKTSPEAINDITQGLFCEAYDACAEDGARLAGGYDQKPGDCAMKDSQSVHQEYQPSGYKTRAFTAYGALHFKCVKP
jgi:hypothetical protein